ncbi:hypothetical protein M1403_03605 [Patescibacteria group bacterium]|nr:hypothetical protein [Patescibacteria group bacterium]
MAKALCSKIIILLLLIVGSGPGFALAESNSDISGNGTGTTNDISSAVTSQTTVVQASPVTKIENIISLGADTGGNKASKNIGEVSIETGSITQEVKIENKANANVTVTPPCPPSPPPPGPPPPGPPQPPILPSGGGENNNNTSSNTTVTETSSSGNNTGSSPNSPEVLGASTGEILPATGNNWYPAVVLLWFVLISLGLAIR